MRQTLRIMIVLLAAGCCNKPVVVPPPQPCACDCGDKKSPAPDSDPFGPLD